MKKRITNTVLLLVMIVVGLGITVSTMTTTAIAASNPYVGGYSNCTWTAWQQAKDNTGVELPWCEDAKGWASHARTHGYTVSNTPRAKSVVVYGATSKSPNGHVAYVADYNSGTNQIYVKEGGYNGGYHDGWTPVQPSYNGTLLGFIYLTSNDNTGPSYSDFHICEIKTDQFTVMAKVTDPSGVKNVSYAVWTTNNGQDDLVWYDGVDPEGNSYYWRWIPFSDHNNEKGQYIVDMYAYDNAGNCTTARVGYNFTSDNTAPVVSNVKVESKDSNGYTVSCKVTDSGSGVNRVQFPTWTPHNGQDDLAANWQTNKAVKGTKNGDTYTFRVNRSEHNNEFGDYITDIYAWDNAGNETGMAGRIGVTIHNLVRVLAKAATTSAEGNIEYWTCSDCGKYFRDSAGKNEITKADTIIPKIEGNPGGNDQPSIDPDDSDELPIVTIVKLKAAKKALAVKWKKLSASDQSKVSGIQIQYSTSKNFKKGAAAIRVGKSKSLKKIKKLKAKKRYYVRIRTYQDTAKATYYSDWSAIKTIKTK